MNNINFSKVSSNNTVVKIGKILQIITSLFLSFNMKKVWPDSHQTSLTSLLQRKHRKMYGVTCAIFDINVQSLVLVNKGRMGICKLNKNFKLSRLFVAYVTTCVVTYYSQKGSNLLCFDVFLVIQFLGTYFCTLLIIVIIINNSIL